MPINTYLSMTTLNVNGLKSPIKDRGAEQISKKKKKKRPIYCLQKTHFISKDTQRLKVKWWGKTFHASGIEKKASTAIVI